MHQSPFSHDQGLNHVQSKKSRFLKINLVLLPLLVTLGFVIYHLFIDDETGCDTYASKYSCKYIVEEATYDVYYWANVSNGNPDDDKLVGTVKGLPACLAHATEYNKPRIHKGTDPKPFYLNNSSPCEKNFTYPKRRQYGQTFLALELQIRQAHIGQPH